MIKVEKSPTMTLWKLMRLIKTLHGDWKAQYFWHVCWEAAQRMTFRMNRTLDKGSKDE